MIGPQDNKRFHARLLRQVEALPPEDRHAALAFVAFVLERRRQRAAVGEIKPGEDRPLATRTSQLGIRREE